MGNRAVVAVEGSSVGIYLHWNGGIESIAAFLRAAKDLGVRDPVRDTSYFYARFAQLVGNYFGGSTSIGIEAMNKIDQDNGDNGVYIVGADFAIVKRLHGKGRSVLKADQAKSDAIYADVMAANKAIFGKNA